MRKFLALLLVIVISTVFFAADLYFASTQMHPAAEREFMQTKLSEFSRKTGISVEFLPLGYTDILTRIAAEQKTGKVKVGLVADLQGGLYLLNSEGYLADLKDLHFYGKTFVKSLEKYAYVGDKKVFIPWLQATYVMVVNKKAFDYLPKGLKESDVIKGTEKWTYDSLLAWVRRIYDKTGRKVLGFPIGPRGLWHRFLHGYIYPSFTGAQAIKFDSVRAVEMWEYLKKLFKYVHPASSTWDQMSEPLLRGEVWIAWDHTARIKDAIVTKPDDFVVVPVPRGPMGRGYIIVLAGLSIPKGADVDKAKKLIDYLTDPEVQVDILKKVGFFPVVEEATGVIPEGALKVLAKGVINQSSTKDSIIAFIPNLGPRSGDFTQTYRIAFRRIVFEDEDIVEVIKELGEEIRTMFKETNSPLPVPDNELY